MNPPDKPPDKAAELAYLALLLERQIESYERLHEEELASLREGLHELERRILAMGEAEGSPEAASESNLELSAKEENSS